MARKLKQVLIGDGNARRFAWLQTLLDEEFGLESVQAYTLNEVLKIAKKEYKRSKSGKRRKDEDGTREPVWTLIFIVDNLPMSEEMRGTSDVVKGHFSAFPYIEEMVGEVTILVRTTAEKTDWAEVIPKPTMLSLTSPPKSEDYRYFVRSLEDLGLHRLASLKDKLDWDRSNRILRDQIRALSDSRNLKDGKSQLARLISKCIDCQKVESVEIKQIGQGKSGSAIFRFRVHDKPAATPSEPQEYVLKLYRAGSVWKLENEVRGHIQVERGLGHRGYREHIPKLKPAWLVRHSNEYIVSIPQWYAVHFDFLGGKRFGKFIDLESTIIASADELETSLAGTDLAVRAVAAGEIRAVRIRILNLILEWLSTNWYGNVEAGQAHRRDLVMWNTKDAPPQKYIAMPPYRLTGRAKGWIQAFLDSREAEIGARFFPDWEQRVDVVTRFVSEYTSKDIKGGELGKTRPVLISHVHGDLNASNVLLWIKYKHPFLIDFPFYQDAGHALQDFACLEVEVKLALLDRQRDSPEKRLRAFEYTSSQMPLWTEMEDRLLDNWDQSAPRWQSKGYKTNVQLCWDLVHLIRSKAREVQQNDQCNGSPPGEFLMEYWPALLYHTLLAISYPSFSVFKRLIAVYVSSSILNNLGYSNVALR